MSQLGCSSEKLHEEPEAEKEVCGNLHHGEDNKEGKEGNNPGTGKEDEVGTQHSRNSTGCADVRHHGGCIDENLGKKREETTKKVKEQVFTMAESVFHIIPENVEVEHIAQNVEPASVEEHGGDGSE